MCTIKICIKTKILSINPHKTCKGHIRLNGVSLESVNSIEYLGIMIDNRINWKAQMDKSSFILAQRSGALHKLVKASTYKPVSPVLEIYRAKVQSAVLYGAEIWGYACSSSIRVGKIIFLSPY